MDFTYLEHVSDACFVANEDGSIIYQNIPFLLLGNLKEREIKKKSLPELLRFKEEAQSDLAIETTVSFSNGRECFVQLKVIELEEGKKLYLLKDLSIETTLQIKYQNTIQELRNLNVNLERQVQVRTEQLLKSNSFLKGILESFRQAIFMINLNGDIDLENAFNLSMLGVRPPEKLDTIFGEQFTAEETQNWLKLLFNANLEFQDMVDLAPTEVRIDSIPYQLNYYPYFGADNKLHSLIVALTNISKELQIREELAAKERLGNSLLKASRAKERFLFSMNEVEEIFQSLLSEHSSRTEALPKLHALKGIFSYYGPVGFDSLVHEIELADRDWGMMKVQITLLYESYESFMKEMKLLLPHLNNESIQVPQSLLWKLSQDHPHNEDLLQVVSLKILDMCHSFGPYLEEISTSVGKELGHFQVNVIPVLVDPQLSSLLNQFLIHGLRNSVSHVFGYPTDEKVQNELEIQGRMERDSFLITVITSGPRSEKRSDHLSGRKQGLALIENLARRHGAELKLDYDDTANVSQFSLAIPKKFIRGSLHVEV